MEFVRKNLLPFILGLIFITLFTYTAIFVGGILKLLNILPSHLVLVVSSAIAMLFVSIATAYFIKKEGFWKTTFIFVTLYSLYGFFVAFPLYFSAFGENSIYILGLLMIAGFIPSFLISALLMKPLHKDYPKISMVLTAILVILFVLSFIVYLADLDIIKYHHPRVTEIFISN